MTQYTIKLSNSDEGVKDALELTERTGTSIGLKGKDALKLRLLAEEMMNMLQAIAGEFNAEFYFEHEGRDCKLHLSAKSDLDYEKRRELLSVSSSGKNEARVGIMEKIRGIFEAGLWGMQEGFALQSEYGMGMFGLGAAGMPDDGVTNALYSWSMQKYKTEVREDADAWDELEKSIIANIADEVSVAVKRDSVVLTVRKNFR